VMLRSNTDEAKAILNLVSGEQRARLLLVVAEHFVFLPDALPVNLDRGFIYINEARQLSGSIHSVYWQVQCQNLLGKYYYTRGQFSKGKSAYLDIISRYHQLGDRLTEAHWWSELGLYMPDNDSTYNDEVSADSHAIALYLQLRLPKEEADVLFNLAAVHLLHNKPDTAIRMTLSGITLLKVAGTKKLFAYYEMVAKAYRDKGDLNNALKYALQSYQNEILINHKASNSISMIADIYREMGETGNSIIYYKQALEDQSKANYWLRYINLKYLAEEMVKEHKGRQALLYIQQRIAKDKPMDYKSQEIIAAAQGECYQAMGYGKIAERNYLEMIRLDNLIQADRLKSIFNQFSISGPEAYYLISKFYVTQGQFAVAAGYVKKARSFSAMPVLFLQKFANVQGKIDSAAGNFREALAQFQTAAQIKDSLFSIAHDKQIQALRFRFETAEKEKDLALLHKDILLQNEVIAKSGQAKKFTYAGIALLLILLGVIFNRYRLKQRSNMLLEDQKKTIILKNEGLTQLVTEKEWLIKEVHHRVKNNLQIVMTLLSGQMNEGATDDESLMQESIRRVQAMSLLHQRLYREDNSANVAMRPYIHELIDNLKESFGTGNSVLFRTTVEDIELDMVQAVPIGLIFNEAITNSLKYAFKKEKQGEIEVTLSQLPKNHIRIVVSDNGKGLPADFDINNLNSFGLKLIRGLTDEIDGSLVFESFQGTGIIIEFEKFILNRAGMAVPLA
jgi:two-component sensor histidine kinase